jgi:hypothetical protein
MRDEPSVDGLLDAARESLLEYVLPVVPPDHRLEVLMIANAIAIARRVAAGGDSPLLQELQELEAIYAIAPGTETHGAELSAKLHELNTRLARDIRAGTFDQAAPEHDAVESLLWRVTLGKLRESRPKMLKTEGIE